MRLFEKIFSSKVILKLTTKYNQIRVLKEGITLKLILDDTYNTHSIYNPASCLTGSYWDIFIGLPMFFDYPPRVLVLGLGAGTVARGIKDFFPRAKITGVEIDPEVVRIGRELFGMPDDIEAVIGDVLEFLERCFDTYDIIISDIFLRSIIPLEFKTSGFYRLVKSRLREDGIFSMNFTIKEDAEYSARVLSAIFGYSYIVKSPESLNHIAIASCKDLRTRLIPPDRVEIMPLFRYIMYSISSDIHPYRA